MKLPNRDKVYIPPGKLEHYLLSEIHPVGRLKARFFRGIGFEETNINSLEQGLLAIAHEQAIKSIVASPYGMKYIIEGTLETPTGRNVEIVTVWVIEIGQKAPRFVTAYPT